MATIEEIGALVAPATPHFAYQIRARVRELVLDLPEDNPVRRHAGEDGAARPARPCLVKADDARREAPGAPAGTDPELGAGGRPAPVAALTASSVLVTGARGESGERSRGASRRTAQAGGDRLSRNDAAAEAAEELRLLGAEPVLVRGNVASTRVADEVAALGPLDAVVHCAATG